MSATQTVTQLTEFARRGADTDAGPRAAVWLRDETESPRREATIDTFSCRPNWALAHSCRLLVGIAGSLVMVSNATLGGALVLVALLSILADGLTGRSPGRRLTPERASQNVVGRPLAAEPPAAGANGNSDGAERLGLIVTANYDAGRADLVHRPWLPGDRVPPPPGRCRPVHPRMAGMARDRTPVAAGRGRPARRELRASGRSGDGTLRPAAPRAGHRARTARPAMRHSGNQRRLAGRAGPCRGLDTAQDSAERVDPRALDELLQFTLMLVDAIDADLVPRAPGGRDPLHPAAASAHL